MTVNDVYEAIGGLAKGTVTAEELHELEGVACPGAGACGGQFTANTMSTILEFLGISPPGLNAIPALSPRKAEAARGVRAARGRPRPRRRAAVADRHPRGDRERRRLGRRDRRLDERRAAPARDRARVRDRAGDRRLRPDRRADAGARRHEAVGPLPRDRRLPRRRHRARHARAGEAAGSSTASGRRSTGARSAEVATAVVEEEGQEVVRPIDAPIKASGSLRILRGNLAPDGCVVKLTVDHKQHRGPARVFDDEQSAFAAVKAKAIQPGDVVVIRYEGPAGGPGMPEMLQVTAAIIGEGLGDSVALDHRRALLRRHPRVHGRPRLPEAFRGGPIAALQEGDMIAIDVEAGELAVELSDDELALRGSPPGRRRRRATTSGVLAKYAALVTSASEGAITRPTPTTPRT